MIKILLLLMGFGIIGCRPNSNVKKEKSLKKWESFVEDLFNRKEFADYIINEKKPYLVSDLSRPLTIEDLKALMKKDLNTVLSVQLKEGEEVIKVETSFFGLWYSRWIHEDKGRQNLVRDIKSFFENPKINWYETIDEWPVLLGVIFLLESKDSREVDDLLELIANKMTPSVLKWKPYTDQKGNIATRIIWQIASAPTLDLKRLVASIKILDKKGLTEIIEKDYPNLLWPIFEMARYDGVVDTTKARFERRLTVLEALLPIVSHPYKKNPNGDTIMHALLNGKIFTGTPGNKFIPDMKVKSKEFIKKLVDGEKIDGSQQNQQGQTIASLLISE